MGKIHIPAASQGELRSVYLDNRTPRTMGDCSPKGLLESIADSSLVLTDSHARPAVSRQLCEDSSCL